VLRTRLLQPDILRALAAAGHGSLLLVTDGNFPHATAPFAGAPRVYLNLSPGVVTVEQALEAILSVLPVERAALMDPQEEGSEPPAAHASLMALLPSGTPVDHIRRLDFYAATRSDDLALVVATADQRPYANVLLTVGVVSA
jgi:L-fucose mutarotase